jgi:acyl-CoA synthetase (AMP-forming)/AMP-acid ligase II
MAQRTLGGAAAEQPSGDDGGGQGQLGLDVRTRLADANPGGGAPPFPLAFPPERRLVCVYTSGSTGSHVACPKTAAQLLGEAALLVRLWDLGPGTRVLATVPPHHLYGLLFGVLVPFMGGGSFVRTTPLHAETIAAQARARQANVLVSVPAHLHAVATLLPGGLVAVARIFSSGAPLDAATASAVTALAGIPVTEVLGSSETGGIAWRESGGDGTWAPFPDVHVAADEDGTMLLTAASRCSAAPTASSRSVAAASRSPRSNACCVRFRASPTPPSFLSTRRRPADTSCGRPSWRRRCRSRPFVPPSSTGWNRSRCPAASGWSPRCRAKTTASW